MEERLKRLIALRAKAQEELDKLVAERQAITDLAKEEVREDLTPEEDAEFRAKSAAIAAKQTEAKGLDERITELADEIERSGKLSEGAAAVRRAQARVESVKEARAYEKGNGHSYFADLIRSQRGLDGGGVAAERLRRHAQDVATEAEYRDMDTTDGNGGFFVPPVWLVDQFAELPRAGRAYANLIPSEQLPPKTNSINIPKVTAGTAVAFQNGENTPVNEQDMDDATIEAKVRTIAGQADISIQLLEQSAISFDEMIFRDLIADYAVKVDKAVLAGTGTNGQVLGVHATPGITTIPVTTVDVAGFYAAIADGIQRIHTQRHLPASHIVMHPRRWAWLTAELGNDGRPLVLPSANNPQNAVATMAGVVSEQVVGTLQGLPVVTDPNIGTVYGVGTNEDAVYVQRSSDLALYESSIRSRVLPEVGSGTLTVRLQVYGFLAFTAERYPQSVVEITGLTAPTF